MRDVMTSTARGWPTLLLVAVAATAPAGVTALAQESVVPDRVAAVIAAYDRMAGKDLWPGFEPRSVPLAIYDGTDTWLFRHPSPPEGFEPGDGPAAPTVFRGRHGAVRANTATHVDGVPTAIVMLEGPRGEAVDTPAGRLIHEAFHVFQRRRHPTWSGNEVELLVYPVDDSVALGLRRLETVALRGALLVESDGPRRAWTRRALELRGERFARLPEGSVDYERGTELNEGLARYVEVRALGPEAREILHATSFPPEVVRQRAYATGHALAVLLDDIVPGWKTRLASDSAASLDELLREALPPSDPESVPDPERYGEEHRDALAGAGADVRALQRERLRRLESFLGREGWRIEVVASAGRPLWPSNFDPLNVVRVDGSRVLHTRWISLQNEAGTVEVLDGSALTVSASDDHPLFAGVERLVACGLSEAPDVTERDGVVRIEAPGLEATFEGATVERSDERLVIRL